MNNELSLRDQLAARIRECEHRKNMQEEELKAEVQVLLQKLRPSQLVKATVNDFFQTPGLRNEALKTSLGWAAGFVGKKLLIGSTGGIFNSLLRGAVQFGVTTFVKKKMKRKSNPPADGVVKPKSGEGMY